MKMNSASMLLLLLMTALLISTNPAHSQRQRASKGRSYPSSSSVSQVHLYNYVVEAGTGVNFKSPIRPVPLNLRWSSYAIDKALDGERFASADDQSRRFVEKCQERWKRPCTEVFSIYAPRKSLSMSEVPFEQADIIRVFQSSNGGFSSQFVQRRYNLANETAFYHQDSLDNHTEDAQLDRFEIKDFPNINYAIYLSVYEGHVCSFASKPRVVNRGDTLRLRCQIVMNGFWVPSLFFRNEYDGSVYEANTTLCSSSARPYRYCGLVDVRAETTVLAFACHVRFPVEGRFQPTLDGYRDAQWPHHNHHSPICYLERLHIDTIPSDVNFLCDNMPCDDTINVGQEISCQAEAYPAPMIQLSVLIAELHPEYTLTEATPEDDEVDEDEDDGESENGSEEELQEMAEEEEEEEEEEQQQQKAGRLFLDSDDDAEETTEPATTASEPPEMEVEQQQQNETTEDTETEAPMDEYDPLSETQSERSPEGQDASSESTTTEAQSADGLPSPIETPEVSKPESETPEGERLEEEEREVQRPTVAEPEVDAPEVTKPKAQNPDLDRPTEETRVGTDERNDPAKGTDDERNRGRPKQKDNVDKDEGSGEPEQKEKDKEDEGDNWGSEGKGEKVTTVEVYKVASELVGKVLEVSCNISNSLGWGSNTIVLHVRPPATPSSPTTRSEDGTKAVTRPRIDQETIDQETIDQEPRTAAAQTPQPHEPDEMMEGEMTEDVRSQTDATDQLEVSVDMATDDDLSLSTAHHIDRVDQEWQNTVPTEEGVYWAASGTMNESKQVDKAAAPTSHIEQSGEGSGEDFEYARSATPRDAMDLPTAAVNDREAQMELARKHGPQDIKVYCNQVRCIGSPRLLVGDTLRCEAQGTPKPRISFMTEHGRVIDSATYQLTEDDRGSLTITCVAKNQYGSMTSRIVLTVSAKRDKIVTKFRKDSSAASPRMQSFIVGFNAFLALAVAHHRLLSRQH